MNYTNRPDAKSICFVSPYGYPILTEDGAGAGGAERQFFLFGRALAEAGWEISFITHRPPAEHSRKPPFFPVFPVDFSYLGGSKLRMPGAWLQLMRAMRRADADFYALKTPGHLLSVMLLGCRLLRKKLVFWAQMTFDANPSERTFSRLGSAFQDYGTRRADFIIAQSEDQRRGFRSNYGREAVVVRNICGSLARGTASAGAPAETAAAKVLWVGNSLAKKRPEVALELARCLPQFRFAMAMNNCAGGQFERVRRAAAPLANVRFLGQVASAQMEDWFAKGRVLLSTSVAEGFPNTFLQAWMNSMPVVSLEIDPDQLIQSRRLGLLADSQAVKACDGNPAKLAECLVAPLTLLLTDHNLRSQLGANAKCYVEEHHSPERVVPALIDALEGK